MKDLDVSVTNDLSWISHINIIIQMKQNGGYDKRSVGYNAPKNATSYSTVHLFVVNLNTLLQIFIYLIS